MLNDSSNGKTFDFNFETEIERFLENLEIFRVTEK